MSLLNISSLQFRNVVSSRTCLHWLNISILWYFIIDDTYCMERCFKKRYDRVLQIKTISIYTLLILLLPSLASAIVQMNRNIPHCQCTFSSKVTFQMPSRFPALWASQHHQRYITFQIPSICLRWYSFVYALPDQLQGQ